MGFISFELIVGSAHCSMNILLYEQINKSVISIRTIVTPLDNQYSEPRNDEHLVLAIHVFLWYSVTSSFLEIHNDLTLVVDQWICWKRIPISSVILRCKKQRRIFETPCDTCCNLAIDFRLAAKQISTSGVMHADMRGWTKWRRKRLITLKIEIYRRVN